MVKDLFHYNLYGTGNYKARLQAIEAANAKIQEELDEKKVGVDYKVSKFLESCSSKEFNAVLSARKWTFPDTQASAASRQCGARVDERRWLPSTRLKKLDEEFQSLEEDSRAQIQISFSLL